MRPPDHDVVPAVLSPGDPRSGDEALYEPGSPTSWRFWGGVGDDDAYFAQERAFHALHLAILGGDRPWSDPELARLGAALRVDHPLLHDRRPSRVAELVVPDEALADAAEDLVPDLGIHAERVTGDDRPPDVVVAAALLFVPMFPDGKRPMDWWSEEEPDRPLARSARVVDEAPPCLWQDGVPLLPLAPRRVPSGPAPAGVYVGRAYRVGEGWAWSTVLPLPALPSVAPLRRRLELELWRLRLQDRRATWEDLLRRRPEVVYRACCEGAEAARSRTR